MVKRQLALNKKTATVIVAVLALAIGTVLLKSASGQRSNTNTPRGASSTAKSPQSDPTLDLSPSQLNSIKVEAVGSYQFPVEKEAVGSIGFVDDLSVQVFPPYQGKLIKTFVELGDEVQKGQPLYTIDSPDLIQAESTLIGAAATLELTSKELARARDLYATNVGVPERETEQAVSDQQTAEGALKAATRRCPRLRENGCRNRSNHCYAQD